MISSNGRTAEYPINPLFLDRWSPRSFSAEAIADADLFTLFEAARWAPSSSNLQPWRILYAKRDTPDWPLFLQPLNEKNQAWAGRASALLAILSRRTTSTGGSVRDIRSHAFDAGAAWACLALQASLSDWVAHAIGGFDAPRARDLLGVPDDLDLHCFVAIGRSTIDLGARNADGAGPNGRSPQASFVRAGPTRA